MAPRIMAAARPGQESVTRPHLAVVGAQRASPPGPEPICGSRRRRQVQHQKLSTSAAPGWNTIWGLTSMSVGTPIIRRVCCTTWLNTGAATSPP